MTARIAPPSTELIHDLYESWLKLAYKDQLMSDEQKWQLKCAFYDGMTYGGIAMDAHGKELLISAIREQLDTRPDKPRIILQ